MRSPRVRFPVDARCSDEWVRWTGEGGRPPEQDLAIMGTWSFETKDSWAQWALPGFNCESPISVSTVALQVRAQCVIQNSDWQAKEMPDKMQDRLWNFVIECRNRCQTEFESSWHIICDVLPNRTWSGMSGYVKWIARWDVKIICLFRDRLMDFPLTMQISSCRVGKAESKNIFQRRLLWSSKIVFCLPLSGNGVKYYIYNISVFDAP